MLKEDRIPEKGLNELFNKDRLWWKRPDLITEGFHYASLSKYFEHFPQENILVYFNEDFKLNPKSVLRDIFDFIGVETSFSVDTDIVVNKSGMKNYNVFNA